MKEQNKLIKELVAAAPAPNAPNAPTITDTDLDQAFDEVFG